MKIQSILHFSLLFLIKLPSCLSFNDDLSKCNLYSKLENEIHCGPSGYLQMFGKKYCIRFNTPANKEKFDEDGKLFVDCTTDCLLKHISDITHKEEEQKPPDCTDLYYQAFESHVKCYLACNFCKVCKTNKSALLAVYEVKDFMSRAAIKQIYQVMKKCGILTCF